VNFATLSLNDFVAHKNHLTLNLMAKSILPCIDEDN